MAENKKSFVLYSDLDTMVQQLPNEKAGELFKLILDYVNDRNPKTDDLLLKIAFEPIKQQLKRDLVKWAVIKDKRSEAGKKSAEIKNKRQQNQQVLTSVESVQQTSTKSTVSVNDNVNVIQKKEGVDFNFDSLDPKFKTPFMQWFAYKQKIKPFTRHESLEASFKELVQLSGNSSLEAMKIVQFSIANEYKSLCKPNEQKNTNSANFVPNNIMSGII